MPALTAAGFRAIAPDLRGFGASDAPEGVEAYSLPFLFTDVLGVLDHLGIERAHVVGHDWGAALAWGMAALAPDRVDHLVALSVGHPSCFAGAGLPQREKSWYMLLFQFAGSPRSGCRPTTSRNFAAWARHPDHAAAVADLSRPGRLTSGFNWYRANVPPEALVAPPIELPPVAAPTMGIWSSGDIALLETQMTGSRRSSRVRGVMSASTASGTGCRSRRQTRSTASSSTSSPSETGPTRNWARMRAWLSLALRGTTSGAITASPAG